VAFYLAHDRAVLRASTPAAGCQRTVSMMSQQRRHAISRRMKDLAVRRQCPECGRKNAMLRSRSTDGTVTIKKCRWCGFLKEWHLPMP
jgi:predicted RNA-binding Zn-ribbon protein involved in translation (DUF1610 family)